MTILRWTFIVLVFASFAANAPAQTSISGNSLAFRSTGSNLIGATGYVGTYVDVPDSGDGGTLIELSVSASRGAGTGDPHLNIVVADSKFGFGVTESGAQDYGTGQFWLPAGKHFVRVERDSPGNAPLLVNRNLTIDSLSVTGASFNNMNSTTNALEAADSYIEHFRQGSARISVVGAAPGTEVHVKQVGRDFLFGTAVAGTTLNGVNSFLNNANYRDRLLENFNAVVPENAGKWASSQPPFGLQAMDAILQFAEDNGLTSRMHNLIWQSQQPNSINTLIAQAGSSATAKAQLRQAISDRIDYYVGDRAHRYTELDVLNEALRSPAYWNIFTPSEIAGIYAEVRDTAVAAGANVGLYANEYNVLQHNNDPETGQSDPYANWHRNHTELLNNAGFGDVVSGMAIQYYVRHDGSVSVPRIQQVFQNMGVTGLPLTLTEFAVQSFGNPTPEQSANYLEDTMRMMFGTPHATSFIMWGFWEGAIWSGGPLAALYDMEWNPTAPGERYQELMDEWTTEENLIVGEDGFLDLRGFYGDYEITVDGIVYDFDLSKGTALGVIVVAPGDYNADGVVDAADYVVWRMALDSQNLRADGNGDLIVDEADYGIWASRLGTIYGPGAGSISHVPEPAGMVLATLAVVGLIVARRRR